MKTSVYIPCDKTTLTKLDMIISLYNKGTLAPNEIVVNAFEIDDQSSLDTLLAIAKKYPDVLFYARKTYGYMSDLMHYAKRTTHGDVILFHSPDKLPSLRRVELMWEYFMNYDSLVVHHRYFNKDVAGGVLSSIPRIEANELYKRYFPFDVELDVWRYGRHYGDAFGLSYVDMASVCVRKEVLDEISWHDEYELKLYGGSNPEEGCCYDFCFETLYKYKKSVIMDIPLTIV